MLVFAVEVESREGADHRGYCDCLGENRGVPGHV